MFLVFGAMCTVILVTIGVTICGTLVCGPIILAWPRYLKEENPSERVRRIGNRACICCVAFFVALIPIIMCGIVVNRMLQEQLISAAGVGDTKTVERTLRIGIDVDATDEGNYTPLMLAAEGGYTDTVKVLLRYHAYINQSGGNGDTALKLAQRHDHQDVERVLEDAGATE